MAMMSVSVKAPDEDTEEELAENEAFLADLDKNCDKKKKEWEIYVKLHSEEKLAISETIKILNEVSSKNRARDWVELSLPTTLRSRSQGLPNLFLLRAVFL